ncbi:MAG: ActS/PrrB/RegB family redox-sensitive histidine kinase, partial [Pseudomonadota bacterium]
FDLPVVYKIGVLASVTACLTFLALYAWRLAKEAREMTTALAATELVLAREQRLHALDGLAAAAAHELGTPLATIVLIAGELEREHNSDPALNDDLALLRSQAQRCREILQTLTRSPSEQDPMHSELTLAQIADEASAPYRDRGVEIRILRMPEPGSGPPPVAERRPGVLYGVGNLVENAVDFARYRVEIEIDWSDEAVSLTIRDDGPGFQTDVLEQLGDPYLAPRKSTAAQASRRRSAGGLGLGVFIAKTLLERSGATLEAQNRPLPDRGAIIRVTWPRDRFEAPLDTPPAALLASDAASSA